jgi:hypothetical protein
MAGNSTFPYEPFGSLLLCFPEPTSTEVSRKDA